MRIIGALCAEMDCRHVFEFDGITNDTLDMIKMTLTRVGPKARHGHEGSCQVDSTKSDLVPDDR